MIKSYLDLCLTYMLNIFTHLGFQFFLSPFCLTFFSMETIVLDKEDKTQRVLLILSFVHITQLASSIRPNSIFFALYRFRKPFYLSLADLQFSPHLELWCPWCHLFLQIYDTLSIYSWSYFLIFIIGTFSIKIGMNQKIPHTIALASSNTSPFSSSLKTYKNT